MGAEHTPIPYDTRWLRSRPTASLSPDQVDAENGVLRDVVMVQEGPAKGHGVHLESEFVEQLANYAQSSFGDRGVKARFGHPGASDNTMGSQMGYYRNIRKRRSAEGKMQAIGDLHLLSSADESPTKPGMRSYILKMAAESPDFLMSSIVFSAGGFYQRKPNGNKHILERDMDPFSYDEWANYREDWGDIFVSFGSLHYTDLVDDGAATDNLFSAEANPHLFVSQAEMFLSEHPHLLAFLKNNPEKTLAFLTRLGLELPTNHTPPPSNMSKIMDFLFGADAEKPEGAEEQFDALQADFAAAKTRIETLQSERDDLTTRLADADVLATELQAQVAKLEADALALKARITELEKEPAAKHTNGDTDTDTVKKSLSKTPVWDALREKMRM